MASPNGLNMTLFPKIEFLPDSKEHVKHRARYTLLTDSYFKCKITSVNYLAFHFGFSLTVVLSVNLIPIMYLVTS